MRQICYFFLFTLLSCTNNIIITREYIYKKDWGNGNYNEFSIIKLKYEINEIEIHDNKFDEYKLRNYKIDSSFCYYHFANTLNYNSKSYFNKPSNNLIWRNCYNYYDSKRSIGLLELNTWYLLSGILKGTSDVFVYIDNNGKTHIFILGPTNF